MSMEFTGQDWRTPSEQTRHAAGMKRYQKLVAKTAKTLLKAADELNEMYYLAIELDLPGVKGADDNRKTLAEYCSEYGNYLDGFAERMALHGGAA